MATQSMSSGKVVAGLAVAGAAVAAAKVASNLGAAAGLAPAGDTRGAATFLNRATFGATDASMSALAGSTRDAWFSQQVAAAPTPGGAAGYWTTTPNFHLNWIIRRKATMIPPGCLTRTMPEKSCS